MTSPNMIRRIRICTAILVSISTGCLMVVTGPNLHEFVPPYVPRYALYLSMFFLGVTCVWTWRSINHLVLGFIVATSLSMVVYFLITYWALTATGLTLEIISGQAILHLFGYGWMFVSFGIAGIAAGGWALNN